MRRCKYINYCVVVANYGLCKLLRDCTCNYYIPVELDPYWKDIFDETNRRLNND